MSTSVRARINLPIRAGRGPVAGSLVSGLVGQAGLLVTGIIAARVLGAIDRGYLALLILIPTVALLAGNLGVPLAATYFIAREPSRHDAVLRALRSPVIAQTLVLSTLQLAVLWLFVYDEPSRVRWAALVAVPLLAGAYADLLGKAILQGQQRFTAFNILRNSTVAFYLAGVLFLVGTSQTDLLSFVAVWTGANVLSGALSLAVALAGERSLQLREPVARRGLFLFGLRGYLSTLSPVTTFRLDQAVIGVLLPPKDLGLYVAALAFTNLPEVLSRGVGMIALPHVARARVESKADQGRAFLVLTVALTGLVVVVLEVAAGWLVPVFFGADFDDAVSLTRILLIGSFFWGVRRVLTDTASGRGRPGIGSIAEVGSWITIALTLPVLLPLYDAEGVAAAMTASSVASFIVLVVLLRPRDASARVEQADSNSVAPE